MVDEPEIFDHWAIVELLGHRRLAARVREVQLAGAGFLRLDIPDGQTQYVGPSSVYALHPVSEDIARRFMADNRPAPVQRWELVAAEEVDERDDGGREPVPEDQIHPDWYDRPAGPTSSADGCVCATEAPAGHDCRCPCHDDGDLEDAAAADETGTDDELLIDRLGLDRGQVC